MTLMPLFRAVAGARWLAPPVVALTLGCGGAAQAAALNVIVTDAQGVALPSAVVSLDPVSGKLPVKPKPSVEVAQLKRQFVPQVTVLPVGTPVVFANFDTVRHHVYSFSPAKTFELKLYAGIPNVPVVFDKPGVSVVGCNIHDQMAAWIAVVDTPFYGLTGADGRTRLEAVAAGSYRLRVWHPGLAGLNDSVVTPVTVAAADLDQTVVLKLLANPLVAQP